MFFKKPKISKTWKSDSGTGYSIEDDAGRKVVLWFDSGSDDFIKAPAVAAVAGPRVVLGYPLGGPHDSDLSHLALAARRQAQSGLSLGAGGILGALFGRGSLQKNTIEEVP